MSNKQEATLLIDSLPDDTVGVIIELLKKMIPVKQDNEQELDSNATKRRLGIAEGQYNIPDNIDSCNEEIASMFGILQ